ncbi:MAG: hypothetical protein NC430_12210 [bacterium]|nr:hypothetical protein [bacterium]
MRRLIKDRGYTDKLYFYNFCAVQATITAIMIITAMSGVLGLTDLSPLSNIPQWAYGELGIHTALIVWKAKAENQRKYRFGRDGQTYENDEVAPVQPVEMEDEDYE